MQPLTVDDLLPLEEYAARRKEFFDSHRRYLDRYRRVRVGPRLTLVFENRQTLWYRVQEVVRIARLANPREVQQELNLYNRLLPGRDLLQAALLIDVGDPADLAAWQTLDGDQLWLQVAARRAARREPRPPGHGCNLRQSCAFCSSQRTWKCLLANGTIEGRCIPTPRAPEPGTKRGISKKVTENRLAGVKGGAEAAQFKNGNRKPTAEFNDPARSSFSVPSRRIFLPSAAGPRYDTVDGSLQTADNVTIPPSADSRPCFVSWAPPRSSATAPRGATSSRPAA